EVAETSNQNRPSELSPPWAASWPVGACSRMACTLVPENPYEDTAARRGDECPLFAVHSVVTCGRNRFVLIAVISSGSWVKFRFRGTSPCCSARIALASPSTPEANWVCPKLVFTDA